MSTSWGGGGHGFITGHSVQGMGQSPGRNAMLNFEEVFIELAYTEQTNEDNNNIIDLEAWRCSVTNIRLNAINTSSVLHV